MIFISTAWSETMLVNEHSIVDLHQIDEEMFRKLAVGAHSCINKENLAKILDVEFNFEHVQLRPGDALLKVVIKGRKLQPFDYELPKNVYLEFYCYNVYSAETHVIMEKEEIKMEE